MAFSRNTQLAACNLLQWHTHSGIDSLMLRLGLDYLSQGGMGGNKEIRLNGLFQYIHKHPGAVHDGRPLVQLVIEEAAQLLLDKYARRRPAAEAFLDALRADGFDVVDGQLRAAFPETLDLVAADAY
jgi:hypothetical protein